MTWRMLGLSGLLSLCLSLPAWAGSEAIRYEPLDDIRYDITREGVLQLLCRDPLTGQHFLSRVVVLQNPDPDADTDILLGTRHALFASGRQRDCRVRGVPEEVGHITGVSAGKPVSGDATDFSHDWAILQTRERLPEGVRRLRVLAASGEAHGALTFLRRPVDGEHCRLPAGPLHLSDPALIFHDCASRAGLSGTPLVTQINGEAYIVALHVGRYYLVEEEGQEYGVARLVNGEFLDALSAVLAESRRRQR